MADRVRIGIQIEGGVPAAIPIPGSRLGELLERAVRTTLEATGHDAGEISVALLDDAGIAELNRRYLGHEGPTDVISFALHERDEPPLGDLYIGCEEALRNADALGVEAAEEFVRLAVHGTLHVLGHEHAEGPEREEGPMWRLQERIVRRVVETE